MFTLSREKFEITYTSRLFSISTCACVLVYFGIIVIPFVLVFASENFWMMTSIFEEQLDIQYNGQHFISLITSADKVYHFTNQKYYPSLTAQSSGSSQTSLFDQSISLTGSKITVLMDDTNADQVPESLQFRISLYTDADTIKQVTILIPITCYFPSLHFKFDSYLYFQESELKDGKGLSQLQFKGSINFYQQEPMPSSNFDTNIYDRITIDEKNKNQWMSELLQKVFTRSYQVRPNYITRKRSGNSQKQLTIDIELDNQALQICQKWVSLMAILKLAWLQYFSVFIMVWLIGREFLIFLFRFRILQTSRVEQL